MEPSEDGEGGYRKGDALCLDLGSEKDVTGSDSESDDTRPALQYSTATAPSAAGGEAFPGLEERSPRHGGRFPGDHVRAALPPRGQNTEGMKRPDAVGWRDLPRKKQLLVITLARLSEPLVQTSLQVGRLRLRARSQTLQANHPQVIYVLSAEMVRSYSTGLGYLEPGWDLNC